MTQHDPRYGQPQRYGQPAYPRQPEYDQRYAPRAQQPDPRWTGAYPQQGYAPQPPAKPRKKRRVFLWIFAAVQVLFIIWIVAGAASGTPGPSAAAQAAQQCAHGGWQGLFTSQHDCQVHYANGLNDAAAAGKGIGVALIVVFWVVVDFFLGVGYGVYRLASRPR